ncbi:MAG: hypothetical protein A4E53_01177 [Pelotomaculum sp. PtaB.Bin104]|nr:MAG: hypothetical protein A4E53_01177 [Pelotomaculum sp. PtaB.Bin104]
MGKKFTVPMAREEFFNGLVSEWSIYEAIKRKELPAVHIGRRILLDEDTLNTWWQKKQADSVHSEIEIQRGVLRRVQ